MHDLKEVSTDALIARYELITAGVADYCACEEDCIWDNWYFIDKELGSR